MMIDLLRRKVLLTRTVVDCQVAIKLAFLKINLNAYEIVMSIEVVETLLRVKKGVLDEFNNGTVELFYIDRYHYVHI
jgi:hypothetical protein